MRYNISAVDGVFDDDNDHILWAAVEHIISDWLSD